MRYLILTSCTVLVLGFFASPLEAGERPPLFEVRGVFGTAGFVDAERHDVSGLAFRWNATPRFSIEPELLFMEAPLPCYYACDAGGGTDRDVFLITNFIYRLTDSAKRAQPYFVSGIGYLKHREETTRWTYQHETLWMHFGVGLRIRVTERLSLLPEVRVGTDGGYATVSAAYGFHPARTSTEKEARARETRWKVARSFAELSELFDPGMAVYVTDTNGKKRKGTLEAVSGEDGALTLRAQPRGHKRGRKFERVTLSQADVYRIDARTRDPLTNGIYIGAAVGAGLGVLALAGCDCEGVGYGLLYMTGLGASLGMAIDALLPSKKIIYLASQSSSGVGLRVAPIVSKDRKGVMVVIDF